MTDNTKYSEAEEIKHKFALLSGQNTACAVFIGFNTNMDSGIREVNDFNYDRIVETVEQLRKNNIDAVPVFSEQAQDPSKTVVTAGGIQTPVLKPQKLEEAAKQIFDALNPYEIQEKSDIPYQGYTADRLTTCSAVSFEQMAPVAAISKNIYGQSFEPGITHPDTEEFIRLRQKYGFDLESKLIDEAEKQSLLSIEQLKTKNETSLQCVYRAGCLGDNPYSIYAARETKAFAYATPDIECAKMYSGLEQGYGVLLRATSSQQTDSKPFGLVYEMEASPETKLYDDWYIEQGGSPRISTESKNIKVSEWNGRNLETTVTPSQNKIKNIYLHLKKDDKDMFYPIPLKDKRWRAFLALYKSSDTCQRGYMIDRRKKILAEQKVFAGLNNEKKFGLFRVRVKPMIFATEDRKEKMKLANLTIEDKRQMALLQEKNSNTSQKDIAARISELRCSKAQSTSVRTQGKQIELNGTTLKYMTGKNTPQL